MSKKILILGVNGFIGNSLTEAILNQTDWEVFGIDLADNKLENCLGNKRFHFKNGDVLKETAWIEEKIKECDILLPLVAIATPRTYVENPLAVFELDFEANLEVVRKAAKYKTRVIFPSTSEVYGMSPDTPFDEETSRLVVGPTNKSRWIYSTCKQLMDRVIFAMGMQKGLEFTLFRPFNWTGAKLDNLVAAKAGGSRVLTQFIGNILEGKDITLVDGGEQRRCFTDIDDGIDCLMKILENKEGCANGRIFNVGNPKNDFSIRQLAELLIQIIKTYPKYAAAASNTKLVNVDGKTFYGEGYQDVSVRIPSIENAKKYLGWEPKVEMEPMLRKALDYHLTK